VAIYFSAPQKTPVEYMVNSSMGGANTTKGFCQAEPVHAGRYVVVIPTNTNGR